MLYSEGANGPVLDNGFVRVSVHLNRGTFTVEDGFGRGIADVATSTVLAEDRAYTSRGNSLEPAGAGPDPASAGKGLTLRLSRERSDDEPDLRLEITVLEDAPYALIRSELVNSTHASFRLQALHVADGGRLSLSGPPESWRFYKQGWQSWSPTLVLSCSGEDADMAPPVIGPRTRPEARSGRFVSEMMTAVSGDSGGIVAGFVTTAEQLSQLWLDRDGGRLTAACYADGIEVTPGSRVVSEELLVAPAAVPLEAMCLYGDVLAERMDTLPYDRVTSGWCSWYQYFQAVSEAEVLRNLEELSARRDELPVEYVQIDDGYQAEIGDWLTLNEKFPSGMKWLVEQIHGRGFKAGLWLAPFLMGAKSKLWQEHPEWAVQFSEGQPCIAMQNWGQACYALDLTRPEVLAWLDTVFRTVTSEWGFDYVKIDFVYAGAVDGIRHDPNVTRAQAYRHGVQAIREAVGSRFILGCGNPMGPSVGLVDGSRIGPDVAPYWRPYRFRPEDARTSMSEPSCLNSIRNTITRFWMHGRLWMNDPDCLLVRATDTALSGDEVRCLATVIGLTGGMVLDSDDLTKVDGVRRDIFSLLLPVYGRSGVPVDLFEADIPKQLDLDCGTHTMVAIFNWDEETGETTVAVPDRPSHVYDVWERKYLGPATGELTLVVPPHGCRLLAVRPATDRPQVVGTTFHLMQGALELESETWDGHHLVLELRPVAKKTGDVLIHVPQDFGSPRADGAVVSELGDGVFGLSLRLTQPLTLKVEFGAA